MKMIAIAMRVTEAQNYFELRNSISFDLIHYMGRAGFLPVLVPNNLENVGQFLDQFNLSGILLTGGNNIDPKLYHSNENVGDVYAERDQTEAEMVKYAIKAELSIFGICRGFHFLNVFFKGRLLNKIEGHVNKRHKLVSENKDLNSFVVNSYHNQGVEEGGLGKRLNILAKSEDGYVEAFENKQIKLLAIQWHPERDSSEKDILLLKNHFSNL